MLRNLSIFSFLFLLGITNSFAAKVISDSTAQTVTHCGVILDSGAKIDSVVETVATGKRCSFDVTSVPAGAHVISMSYVNIDPVWGRLESVQSAPLNFTKPSSPSQPSGLVIQ